jgi:hypothetical protein
MLTQKGTEKVQTMIDKSLRANNDVLMARIIDAIGNMYSKQEVDDKLSDYVKRDEFNVVKDDLGQIKRDLRTHIVFTQDHLRKLDQDMILVKDKLEIV